MKTYNLKMIYLDFSKTSIGLSWREMLSLLSAENPVAFIFEEYENGEYTFSADWNLKKDMTIRNKNKNYSSIKKKMELATMGGTIC